MANILKYEKLLCALGGAAAVILGKKVITSPKARECAVKGLAKGMKLQSDAKAAYQSMKDEAQDLCYDAKAKAGIAEEAAAEPEDEV